MVRGEELFAHSSTVTTRFFMMSSFRSGVFLLMQKERICWLSTFGAYSTSGRAQALAAARDGTWPASTLLS